MPIVQDFCQFLEAFAPRRLAEDWDNVGLLLGDCSQAVRQAMTCLTVTPESVNEALARQVDLIVTHHPLPFRPLKRITSDTVVGQMLLRLIENHVALYSPHTSFDSAQKGINQRLAEGLGLVDIRPLVPHDGDPDGLGTGRWGNLRDPTTFEALLASVKQFLQVRQLRCVGSLRQEIGRVAVACGSAEQLLEPAIRAGCDALLVGEMSFHACLEAKANQIAILLSGHYASERFAVEVLARVLQDAFSEVEIWASDEESDPLNWV